MRTHKRIRTPWRQQVIRARAGLLPFLVWWGGIYGAYVLWTTTPSDPTYFGFAHDRDVLVNARTSAPLTELHVQLFHRVEAGELLATFDTEDLEHQIVVAQAEVQRLSSAASAEAARIDAEIRTARNEAIWRQELARSTVSLEFPSELRAFEFDVAAFEVDLLRAQLELSVNALEVERIEVQWSRADVLASQNVASVASAEDLRRRLAREKERGVELRALNVGIEERIANARQRRAQLATDYVSVPTIAVQELDVVPLVAGLHAATEVQRLRVAELQHQRKSLSLYAPVAGRVASIEVAPGQFVMEGEAVLVLIPISMEDVAAEGDVELWVHEATQSAPGLGTKFEMVRASDMRPDQEVVGYVISMAPNVDAMPPRLWRDVRIPEYGRKYLIRARTEFDLLPGERVRLEPLSD